MNCIVSTPPPVNRQDHIKFRALWQAWSSIVGEELLTAAASSNGTIKHRIGQVKTLILRHMMKVASSYIRNKSIGSRVDGRSQLGVALPSRLSQQKDGSQVWPDLPCSDGLLTKMTMIGWPGEVQAEANAVFTAQTLGNTGRTYPLGGCQVAICENCISSKQITAFTTHAVALPEPRAPANVLSQKCSN